MLYGAIIGFGKIARTSHLDAYRSPEISGKAKIIAAVEPDQTNRAKSKNDYPDIQFFPSLNDLLKTEKVDFVDITSPPKYHYNILLQCIENNIHIICEKPFTLTAVEAEDIKKKLNGRSLVLIPCHQYKYSPVWKEFKKFIDSRGAKSRALLQFNIFRTQADPGFAGMADYWRTSSNKDGGGILIDTGIHYLYLANWLLGKPDKIFAHQTILEHSAYNCEDTTIINYITKKGIAQITLTWGADKRHNDARIICSDGSLIYDRGDKITINNGGAEEIIDVPNASDKAHYASLYINLFNDFFDAVNRNEIHTEWIEEACQSINILNNCYLSSEMETVII